MGASGRGMRATTAPRADDVADEEEEEEVEDLLDRILVAELALLLTCDDVEDEVEDEDDEEEVDELLLEEVEDELEVLLDDDDEATAHAGTVRVVVSVVTVPPNANALPDHVVLAPTVMPALPITVPANTVLAARVVAADGVQKTSHADAPINATAAPAVDVSAPPVLKRYVPLPFSVRGPPMFIAPALQYTPGVYVPRGPCVVSVERLIAPGANVNVHGCEAKAERAVP